MPHRIVLRATFRWRLRGGVGTHLSQPPGHCIDVAVAGSKQGPMQDARPLARPKTRPPAQPECSAARVLRGLRWSQQANRAYRS